jgi:HK97 gp10 family phage protein
MYAGNGAMTTEFRVKGFAELNKFLETLPAKVQINILRGMVRAAAKPILKAAKQAAPVGEPSEEGRIRYKLYSGALRDSIRVSTRIKDDTGLVTATISAGGRVKKTGADVFYAHFLEFGVRQHNLNRGGRGDVLHHPGIKPQPFMRPAIDSQTPAAILAAGEYVKKRLSTKHGLETAELQLELDE